MLDLRNTVELITGEDVLVKGEILAHTGSNTIAIVYYDKKDKILCNGSTGRYVPNYSYNKGFVKRILNGEIPYVEGTIIERDHPSFKIGEFGRCSINFSNKTVVSGIGSAAKFNGKKWESINRQPNDNYPSNKDSEFAEYLNNWEA